MRAGDKRRVKAEQHDNAPQVAGLDSAAPPALVI
jgi:hypothetical protein